jgi:hypothetical protein
MFVLVSGVLYRDPAACVDAARLWALPTHQNRLELIPGTETKAHTVDWLEGDTFDLKAPILNFTIQELLDNDFRARVAEVLNFWIEYDVENLARIRNGIPSFWVPYDYETNTTRYTGGRCSSLGHSEKTRYGWLKIA